MAAGQAAHHEDVGPRFPATLALIFHGRETGLTLNLKRITEFAKGLLHG
jgi:hypothetical protein